MLPIALPKPCGSATPEVCFSGPTDMIVPYHNFIGYKPDVYFKPQEVWEIRGAE